MNVFSNIDKIEKNKTKWKDHVDRMIENISPKYIRNYQPIGKRDLGRPHKIETRTGDITYSLKKEEK